MNASVWLWIGLFVLLAIVGLTALYLYGDYRASRGRTRSEIGYRQSGPPSLPPGTAPSPREEGEAPRILFGKTVDARGPVTPMVTSVRPVAGERDCPVCRRRIIAQDYPADQVIICPQCRTHVHVECWEYASNRCPNCG